MIRRDDLVLEYLQFYLANPMRKHYVVTANKATRDTLQGVLNSHASSSHIEFLSVQRAAFGWYDKNENVALGVTFSIPPHLSLLADQLAYRIRHPGAAKFIVVKDTPYGTHLLDRSRSSGVGSPT